MRARVVDTLQSVPRESHAILREVREDDLDLLFAFRRDSALQAQLLTVPDGLDELALHGWIARRRNEPEGAFLMIEDATNGEAVGYAQVTHVHRNNRTAFGGIVVAAGARGRGLGRAALRELAEFAKAKLGLRKLLAEIRSDNAASHRLHLSLGYRLVGTLERHFTDGSGQTHDVLLVERLLDKD